MFSFGRRTFTARLAHCRRASLFLSPNGGRTMSVRPTFVLISLIYITLIRMTMLRLLPLLAAAALTFTACRTTYTPVPTLTERDGLQWLHIDTLGLDLPLYGDYWVHDLDDDYFPNIQEDFIEYWEGADGRQGTAVLVNAHTTLPPHAAVMVILRPATGDEATEWAAWEQWLTAEYGIQGWESQAFGAPFGECRQAGFWMPHPELRRRTQVVTYQWVKDGMVLRWLFWSIAADERFLYRESEGLLSRARIEWYRE